MRRMTTSKKANAGLNSATHALQVAARKRRLAMYRHWKKLPKKNFAAVGKEFGVSRQRASVMVKQAMREFSPEYL